MSRFDGATGRARWSRSLAARDQFTRAALVAPNGDLILAGGGDGTSTVLRLAGSNGTERWRGGPAGFVTALALTADGDVVVGGQADPASRDAVVAPAILDLPAHRRVSAVDTRERRRPPGGS